MKLDSIAPVGRSFEEYSLMFDLSRHDLNNKILGVGDGPASFNCTMNEMGHNILSVDPLYIFGASEIKNRFEKVIENIITQVQQSQDEWVWEFHSSPEELKNHRREVIKNFVDDFELGKKENRYIVGELPCLDFDDDQFDLALCSHFLFLYSEHFDFEFHEKSIREMLRVAKEVRIFPLLDLENNKSRHIASMIDLYENRGFEVEVRRVEYELQRGGNEMLRIRKNGFS
jgi:hypothetical protein